MSGRSFIYGWQIVTRLLQLTSLRCVYAQWSAQSVCHITGTYMCVYMCTGVCVWVSLTNISRTQVALKIIIYKKAQGLHKQLNKMVHTVRVYKTRVGRRERGNEGGKPESRATGQASSLSEAIRSSTLGRTLPVSHRCSCCCQCVTAEPTRRIRNARCDV